jgi:hypothetical protein
MKPNIHFWSHLPEFFLEWEKFQTKVVEKIKNTFCVQLVFQEMVCYRVMWMNKIKPDRKHGNKIRRMRIARALSKATNTYSRYVILIAFPLQQWLHPSYYCWFAFFTQISKSVLILYLGVCHSGVFITSIIIITGFCQSNTPTFIVLT